MPSSAAAMRRRADGAPIVEAKPSRRRAKRSGASRRRFRFELALHESPEPPAGRDWHFGFLADAAEARDLCHAMRADGITVREVEDTPIYVGFKCLDPDGHVIEVYAEPR